MTPIKTLAQARKAGWSTRCENIGPEDWPHYGVAIYHAARGLHDYLMSTDASWTLQDARLAAIVKINVIEGTEGLQSVTRDNTNNKLNK